ncbi:putative MFS-type transporter YhjX [Armadillidium vulgare]|nr:putative MFS-type transporter YhjX [Armadillidium vulgare]
MKINMNLSKIKQNRYGIAAVFGGFLLHLTLGNLYSFGNMMTYMDSYMHIRVSSNVTYSNFIWVNSVTTATQGLFMAVGGLLERKIGWFPNKKGFVSGIIVGGFGLGSLGSTFLQTRFLNPNNIPVGSSGYFENPSLLDKVPSVFLLLGGIFFTMQSIACILISKPKNGSVQVSEESETLINSAEVEHRQQLDHFRAEENVPTAFESGDSRIMGRDLTVMEAIRTKEFYILYTIYFFNSIAVSYINAMYKSFGQTFIKNDFFLSEVGSIAAIFNCGGRLTWGKLMDKTTFRFSMILMATSLALFYLTLSFTPLMGRGFFAAWIWCIFFSFSGTFVLISTATEKAFGSTYYSSIYGMLFTNQIVSSVIVSVINETLLHRYGYSVCFFIVSLIVLGSAGLSCILPRKL